MNWLLTIVGTSSKDDAGWLLHQYGRVRTLVDTVALALFGWLVPGRSLRRDRQQTLAAIHAADPYEVVEARTLLYAVVTGIIAGCCGIVALPPALRLLERSVLRATALTPILSQSLEFGTSAIVAGTAAGTVLITAGTAIAVHESRWWCLEQRATARERRIDATLPRAVAFMYALSRSGMSLPRILRVLADNEAVYGAAAAEFGVAVREIDVVGTDVITALEATGQRTPSDDLADLAANLASVLDSNQQLAQYLADHHERSREAATATHEQLLDRLSAAAEGYVTVLVVGPLFLLTTLTILGLVVADTTLALRGIVYVAVPLGSAGFLVAVDRLDTTYESPDGQSPAVSDQSCIRTPPADDSADRWAAQRATLRLYDTVRGGHRWLRHPKATLLANPWLTGLVTLPVGLVWVTATSQSPSLAVPADLASLAGPISEAAAIVCAGYAIVYETERYRRRRIEAAVPDFLDRLGGLTEAGLSVVDAVHRVTDADLGALSSPLERTWRDVEWGADIETALHRLATRVRSPQVTRAITLVTNASRASNDIAPVLSIAATEVRTRRRLDRERTRLLALYLLVIYVAFLVFLGIVAALSATFLPAISTATIEPTAAAARAPSAAGLSSAVGTAAHLAAHDVTIYRSLFFHAAIVQAVCSGLVAGKLAEGTLRGGVKHVAVLLSLAHIAFWLI
ncbi:MAG: Flp pilus assembly protein TadC [Halonotius sp. J07HN6]|nr:MAG: Flp pilus assembly protein TadC [Halonotius sp. J07HN6]